MTAVHLAKAKEVVEKGFEQLDSGQLRKSLESFRTLVNIVSESGNEREQAWAFKSLATVERRLGESRSALEHSETAYTLAEPTGDAILLAEILATRGNIHADLGDMGAAVEDLRRSLATFESQHQSPEHAQVLNNLGSALARSGNTKGAHSAFVKSLSVAESIGDVNILSQARNNLALILISDGEFDRATEYLEADLEYCRRTKEPYGEAITENNLGELEAKRHNYEKARAHFVRAKGLFDSVGATRELQAVIQNLHNLPR